MADHTPDVAGILEEAAARAGRDPDGHDHDLAVVLARMISELRGRTSELKFLLQRHRHAVAHLWWLDEHHDLFNRLYRKTRFDVDGWQARECLECGTESSKHAPAVDRHDEDCPLGRVERWLGIQTVAAKDEPPGRIDFGEDVDDPQVGPTSDGVVLVDSMQVDADGWVTVRAGDLPAGTLPGDRILVTNLDSEPVAAVVESIGENSARVRLLWDEQVDAEGWDCE